MNNPLLQKNRNAGGDIAQYRIVKFGSNDSTVVQAAANTDALIGVSGFVAAKSGEPIDVILAGVAEVEYGGSVTRGAALTADGDGKAVASAAGSGRRIIGFAMVSGADGDIGSVQIAPGFHHQA